jgi:hypothetical protein
MIFIRILVGTLIGLAVLWGALAWALRQPNFGSEPYPLAARADAARLEQHVRFLSAKGAWRSVHNAPGMRRGRSRRGTSSRGSGSKRGLAW